jgi:amino acid adenylation domain-containing protein
MTTELEQRIEKLSPAQRSAFKKQLAQKLKSVDSLKLNRLARDGTTVPLSPQQRRLWTLTQFAPDSTAYNIPGVLSLNGVVNEQLLKEAMAHVASQQRMLKTVIRLDGELPTQVYVPEMGVPFEVHEVRGNIDDSIRDAINVKFDLSNGPLWRAELKRVRDDYSILVLSFHHIIFDGWSLGLFVSGLFRAYSQLLGAEALDVYDLDVQFDEYSQWQVSQLDAIRAKDSAFWRDRLRDAPPALDLFSEGRRPKNELRVGAMQSASLTRDTFEKARLLAREHGTTPFNFFQSVLRTLIYRYTNLSDIVIGTPVSGRDLAETHQLIGLFVNTLPVRVQFDPSASFVDLLKRCRDESASTFEHGDLPFDTIVEVVNPERTPGCNPLFQLLYTYQNKIPALELSGLTVRYESVDIGTSKFDLSLDVFEDVDGLTCLFEYDTQIYSPEQISSLATHFSNLVRSVVEFPETPINKLSFLSETDLKKALTYTNRVTSYEGPSTFTEAFRHQVNRTPNAPCVVDLSVVKSYIDVESSADRMAAVLYNLGVRRGTVVGLCLERSSNLIETVVAVLHVGAAFVVLDPSYPEERLKFMIQDSGSSVVVAMEESAVTLQNVGVHVIALEQLLKESNTISNESIRVYRCDTEGVSRPSDDAYLVYTSGTTGVPKAVSISHSSWMNALFGWNKEYELSTRAKRHLQMASPGFDVFCGDVVRSLGTGGCLVICPRTSMSEPSELFELITSAQITIAEFVPAVFRNFANWLKQTKKRLEHLAVVIVASDAWYYREYREFVEILGEHTRLINSYGLAEATIDSTWFDEKFHKRNSPLNENSGVPIGTPFPNVEVVILDENENLMPPGVPGEICIGGWGLAKGYRNRPELTAQKFISNPFGKNELSRLYKTGDIGVLCADGIIELRGRRDQQVKIRGQRIELGEIESALVTFDGIIGAVVSVHENNGANQYIAAYYVTRDKDTTIDIGRLRSHLEKRLPGYMVPSQYLEIVEIPRTTNGKVNRKALPKPTSDNGSLTTFVSPTTLVQEQLASIWCQVLSQPRVGVRDSFFELGGHSLLAFQVIGRIKRVFGVELPIHTLFSAPSILEIEKVILSLQGVQRTATSLIEDYPIITPDREHRYEPFPLTEVQQAYWLGRNDVFEFGNVTTHSYDELETELIDVEKFESAWNNVIKRHDMLRAVVREDGTQQVLKEIPEYSMPVIDLRDSSDVELQSRISAIRNEMSHQKLDVSRWPVFDIRISLLPQGKARIHFSTDALIWDAWSFATLIHDLVCFYVGETNNLRPLDVTFRDYVLAEKDLMQGEKYKRAVAYWKERISELPPAPALPMAKDPSHLENPRFTRLHRAMDPSRWDRLKLKATKRGMTATGVTLAAYAEVLAKYSQDPRFSLNLTFLNRHPLHPHVNDVVGEFTSLTLLAVDNNDGTTFVERARRIQSNLWHDLEHHAISGVQVLRELGKRSGDATRARMPVVFTSALVVPIPERHPELPMVPVYRDGVTQTSQVWLDCGVWEDQSWLLCNWDVVLELYPNGFAEEMFEAYWDLLVRLADEDTVWDSEVVSRSTFDASEDNRELCEPRRGNTLVSLFLEQAKSRPDALAVVDRWGTLRGYKGSYYVVV